MGTMMRATELDPRFLLEFPALKTLSQGRTHTHHNELEAQKQESRSAQPVHSEQLASHMLGQGTGPVKEADGCSKEPVGGRDMPSDITTKYMHVCGLEKQALGLKSDESQEH